MPLRSGRRHEAPRVLPAFRFALALRDALARGYGVADLRRDVLAGVVVGIVALPLSMALAIASGVPPQHGLYTAIVAGFLCAALGGSPTQVSGPTAAFVVVLVPISAHFGVGGMAVASAMAGVILLALGAFRMGRLIQFIPYPVTAGFTAGIAVVIATLQLKDLLGLTLTGPTPLHFFDRALQIGRALPSVRPAELGLGLATLAVLVFLPRVNRSIPAPLAALALGAVGGYALQYAGFDIATIGSRFSYVADGVPHAGIPRLPPMPVLPWTLPGPGGAPLVPSWHLVTELFPSAFAIALLGAIESLLSAVVADGMAGTRHDPDGELVAQGVGNLIAPFFGGFAATGAIARTATNVRSGGRSPVASMVHALFVLAAVLLLAPVLAHLPMTSLAALLLLVAYNMSEVKHFVRVLKVAPKSDVTVQLACFGLTVAMDMVVAVTAGVLLAALLFMRRMAEITQVKLTNPKSPSLREPLPDGVVLYEIGGPLFFGAAQKAMDALHTVSAVRCVILDLTHVPAMDVTGLVNLESALERLEQKKVLVVLLGLQEQPAKVLAKAGIVEEDALTFCDTLPEALQVAAGYVPEGPSSWHAPPSA